MRKFLLCLAFLTASILVNSGKKAVAALNACAVAPPSGSCTLTGRATLHYVDDTNVRHDENFEGLGVAWIGEPIIPKDQSDGVKTYAFDETDSEGYFEITNIDCSPVHIGIFCGDRVLETYGIEWDKTGSVVDLPLRYSEDLNCGENNFCARQTPDTSGIACSEKQDPEQLEVRYPWGEPEKISSGSIIAACFRDLENFLYCLTAAFSDRTLQVSEFNLDRIARTEGTEFALGCAPIGITSCEDIKEINDEGSGMNLTSCGGSWIRGKTSTQIRETCRGPYEAQETGDQDVCTLPNGSVVKFNQIQLPYTKAMDGNDVLSDDYFPYYLCFQDPADNGRAEVEAIPTVSGLDEDNTCGGPNCNVGSDPTTEDNSTTRVITKSGTASLETANKSGLSLAGMMSRPGKDLTQKNAPTISTNPAIESGITRTRWYGTECTCPDEKKNADGSCQEGGVTYSFTQALIIALCVDYSTNPPSAKPGCPIPNFIPLSIESKVPYVENYSSFGMVSDYFKRPGTLPTPYNSCGGTTTGDTDETENRLPFSSDACATSIRAKEDIMGTFQRPRTQ